MLALCQSLVSPYHPEQLVPQAVNTEPQPDLSLEAALNLQENLVACSFPQSVSLDRLAITIQSPLSHELTGKPLFAVNRGMFAELWLPVQDRSGER